LDTLSRLRTKLELPSNQEFAVTIQFLDLELKSLELLDDVPPPSRDRGRGVAYMQPVIDDA
jgi:hypothetical protein